MFLLFISHRGYHREFPENSLLAFEHSFYHHYQMIETDVNMTKDGQLILFHDNNLQRMTGRNIHVADINLQDLQNIPIKNDYINTMFENHQNNILIPTLEEFLSMTMTKNSSIHVNLELKLSSPNFSRTSTYLYNLKKTLEKYPTYNITLSSFNHTVLQKLSTIESLSTTPIAILTDKDSIKQWKNLCSTINNVVAINVDINCFDNDDNNWKTLIDDVHKQGYEINIWTINDSSIADKMLSIGVNNIFTDDILQHHQQ